MSTEYAEVYSIPELPACFLSRLSQTFGATDKLIFGTDWTATDQKNSIEALTNINDLTRQMNLPETPEQTTHNILHENWKKIFTKLADKLGVS